jgi:hypothetical protein
MDRSRSAGRCAGDCERGVDPAQSLIWHKKAADAGLFTDMMDLAKMYSDGRGVTKDEAQATQWILKAAMTGNYESMMKVANRYEDGLGIARDHDQAIEWMRKAALKETGETAGPAKKWLLEHGTTP